MAIWANLGGPLERLAEQAIAGGPIGFRVQDSGFAVYLGGKLECLDEQADTGAALVTAIQAIAVAIGHDSAAAVLCKPKHRVGGRAASSKGPHRPRHP